MSSPFPGMDPLSRRSASLAGVSPYTVEDSRLVTSIEILSPSNKRPSAEAYVRYRNQRRKLLETETHLLGNCSAANAEE